MYSVAVTIYEMAVGRTCAGKHSLPDMDSDDPCAPLRPRDAADEQGARMYELVFFALRARSADRPSASELLAKIRTLMESGAGGVEAMRFRATLDRRRDAIKGLLDAENEPERRA